MKIRIKATISVGTFYNIRKHLILLMLLTNAILHSQSFSEENTSLYVAKGVTIFIKEKDSLIVLKGRYLESKKNVEKGIIYVSKNTHIYGFNYFENFKPSKTKTTQYTTTFTLNKQKLERSTQTSETKKPTVFVKKHGSKYAFDMLTGTLENAVLNIKFNFLQKNNFYRCLSFADNVKASFSIYSFFPTKEKINSFHTRPPPIL